MTTHGQRTIAFLKYHWVNKRARSEITFNNQPYCYYTILPFSIVPLKSITMYAATTLNLTP